MRKLKEVFNYFISTADNIFKVVSVISTLFLTFVSYNLIEKSLLLSPYISVPLVKLVIALALYLTIGLILFICLKIAEILTGILERKSSIKLSEALASKSNGINPLQCNFDHTIVDL